MQMSPELLDSYLAALRKHGVMSFTLTADGFQANLEPLPPPDGAPAQPGGWKMNSDDAL
jgi:hypothetical protein